MPFSVGGRAGNRPKMPTPRPVSDGPEPGPSDLMDTQRRGNYDSGEDFVLEYGELRFTFNERDFGERCEQAARKLGFVGGRLDDPELEDLVNLAVNGEIQEPASAPGRARQRLLARARRPRRPLARALAAPPRLPLRLARPARQGGRARRRLRRRLAVLRLRPARPRRRAGRAGPRALLGPGRLPRRGSAAASSRAGPVSSPSACARACGDRRRPGARRPAASGAACRWRPGRAPGSARRRQRRVERDDRRLAADRRGRPRRSSASRRRRSLRAAASARRAAAARDAVERVDEHDGVRRRGRRCAWRCRPRARPPGPGRRGRRAKVRAATGSSVGRGAPLGAAPRGGRRRARPDSSRPSWPASATARRRSASVLPGARARRRSSTREPRPIGVSHSIALSVGSSAPSARRSVGNARGRSSNGVPARRPRRPARR